MALSKITNGGLAHSGLPAGTVLQVVKSAIRNSSNDTTSTSYAEISSDYRVTITPKAAATIVCCSITTVVVTVVIICAYCLCYWCGVYHEIGENASEYSRR